MFKEVIQLSRQARILLVDDRTANLVALETRRDETKQALEAARAKYDELSDRFDQLEHELDPSRR